jgi:uncharacterized membrane protein YraQ (UPF0718 family)
MNQIVQHFLHLLVEATPWFLFGVIVAAAIQAFIKPKWVTRWIASKRVSVFNAAVLGAVLPGCSMTTVPLAASLKSQGARLGTLTAFIMISPILSPETIALTAAMLGSEMTIGRIILPLITTLLIGIGLNTLESKRVLGFHAPAPGAPVGSGPCGCGSDGCGSEPNWYTRFWQSLMAILHPLWIYLAVGLIAVSLLQAFVPNDMVDRYLQGGLGAYLAAALIGIPMYVCEGGEVPLTFALLNMGVGIGPAFTFMLGAVGTCIPTIGMAPRIIGVPATYLYVASWLVLAVGAGMIMGAFVS